MNNKSRPTTILDYTLPAARNLSLCVIALCGCLYTVSELNAETRYMGASIREIGATEAVSVPLYKSRIIEVSSPVKKISVGNPDIADILVLRNTEVYIVGKALGTTNVVLWDRNNRIVSTVDIEITHDIDTLKLNLHRLLPREDIKVYSSQGTIVLSGEVSSPGAMSAALSLATSFAPRDEEGDIEEGKVVNLMHVGGVQQVMLEVKVAEINRTVMNKLDINFHSIYSGQDIKIGGVNGGAGFPNALDPDGLLTPIFGNLLPSDGIIGPVLDQFEPNGPSISDTGLFSAIKRGNYFFSLTIDALKRNGLAKVLAEPNLTTLTGQKANFLAGGEFPIPVPQDNGNTTIEFKEFGIGMDFLPIVLDSDRINLSVGIRVDELTDASSVVLGVAGTNEVFAIPSLRSRRATSSLELYDGQTMAIAGLISDNVRENVDKFPGLGDIPILGLLFSSQEYIKDQTELVIFVTPRLATPITADKIRLPTDNFIEPSELSFYLFGQMEGRAPKQPTEPLSTGDRGGLEGRFGHKL
jgi:pilus assembly protein CpaC